MHEILTKLKEWIDGLEVKWNAFACFVEGHRLVKEPFYYHSNKRGGKVKFVCYNPDNPFQTYTCKYCKRCDYRLLDGEPAKDRKSSLIAEDELIKLREAEIAKQKEIVIRQNWIKGVTGKHRTIDDL